MSNPTDTLAELSGAVKGTWHRFLDVYEPLRPDLYRYCRYLTRSPWDAEDLAQDTLARAFVTLGGLARTPANPRAWLFRVASNLWIDQLRRRREAPAVEPPAPFQEPRDAREAAGTLLVRLSPQERAAVVLKDVFELTLEEIAQVLGTTEGAVKAALSGGRGKLGEPEVAPRREVALRPAVLDAFCDAFNARDLDRLAALLLDTSTVEVVGGSTEYGGRGRIFWGMVFGSKVLADLSWKGMDPGLRQGALPTPARGSLVSHRGEVLMLSWYAHEDGDAVRAVNRIEVEGDRIARVRNYFYTPELIAEICDELGVPHRENGYRYWVRP